MSFEFRVEIKKGILAIYEECRRVFFILFGVLGLLFCCSEGIFHSNKSGFIKLLINYDIIISSK